MEADLEITIRYENQKAVLGTLGASLRRYYRQEASGEVDIVWGYSGSKQKRGGQGDVLIPFPGRVRGGRYVFEGVSYQMACNDKDGPNAIHGFLRSAIWRHSIPSPSRVVFETEILKKDYAGKGYPFSLFVRVTYEVGLGGLLCKFEIENLGEVRAPVGVGFHPYFVVGTGAVDQVETRISAKRFLEFDRALLPTGRMISVEGSDFDFRSFRRVAATRFNHCYCDLVRDEDGICRCALKDPVHGRQVTIWMDRAFEYVVVYTGDTIPAPHARQALAIEPMTCATDAFNVHEWGLVQLDPGARFQGSFGVEAT